LAFVGAPRPSLLKATDSELAAKTQKNFFLCVLRVLCGKWFG
jgi:hypothetical protein